MNVNNKNFVMFKTHGVTNLWVKPEHVIAIQELKGTEGFPENKHYKARILISCGKEYDVFGNDDEALATLNGGSNGSIS